jgi:hypothetical protein
VSRTVVAEVVQDMQANGEPLPVPFADKHYSGNFQVRIPRKPIEILLLKRQKLA